MEITLLNIFLCYILTFFNGTTSFCFQSLSSATKSVMVLPALSSLTVVMILILYATDKATARVPRKKYKKNYVELTYWALLSNI